MLAYQCSGHNLGEKSGQKSEHKEPPVLVCLHGFLGSGDDWQWLTPALEKHFHIVIVDLPGHGHSTVLPDDEPGFDGFTDALEHMVEALGLKRFSLLGYSLGGRLAMAYAGRYPQRLDHLLLEGAHPGFLSDDPLSNERQSRFYSDQKWADRFINEPVTQVLEDWYQQAVFADLSNHQRQVLIEARANQSGVGLAKAMTAFSLSQQPDFRSMLKKRPCPVHYFYGDRDEKFGALGRQLMSDHCLKGLHSMDSCGHNIHREQPQALAELMTRLILVES